MKRQWRTPQVLSAVAALVSVGLLSGCSVLGTASLDALKLPGTAEETTAAEATPQPTALITTEIRADGRKPELGQAQLPPGGTIQQILEQTKITKRFKRMEIYVVRTAGDQRQKMDVKFDHTDGMVNPLYDYALHPGDHLVVIEDTTTAFDDMINSFMSPVRRAAGK